jgi:tetratricopeptide (TPR) repeat protein
MKNLFLILIIFILPIIKSKAQFITNTADSQAIVNNIPFPEAYANILVGFNAEMLNINKMPVENKYEKLNTDELLKLLETEKDNIDILIQLYFSYNNKGDQQTATSYLEKAYNKAMELYELNPSNIEVVRQMTQILHNVNRFPDIVTLWDNFTKKNSQVAFGWATLAYYQVLTNDSSAAKSLDKAFSLNPNEPEIYVGAYSKMINNIIFQIQKGIEAEKVIVDLSFFEKAASLKSNSFDLKFYYEIADLIKFYYQIFLKYSSMADAGSKNLKFSDEQEKEWKKHYDIFNKYEKSKKIVNKHMVYKCLILLESLKHNAPTAVEYWKESKKYIKYDQDLCRILSTIYIMDKNFEESIKYLKMATEVNPNQQDNFAIAKMYFNLNKFKDSYAILTDMLNQVPNNYDLMFGIISIYLKEHNYIDACSMLFRMESLFTAETKINEHPYFIFFKAVCNLAFSQNKADVQKHLLKIAESDSPWKNEAKELLLHFFN